MINWIDVNDSLPEHKDSASKDVVWLVEDSGYWGRGNVGLDGEWYKDGILLNCTPTHWFDPRP